MKKLFFALSASLLFAACVDTTGLSADSTRPPRGNPDAGVTILEFADLQCPACKAAHTLVSKPVLDQYGDRVRFVFKHFPLQQIHRYAMEAAEASECSADQGKFWEFVDMTYEQQDKLSSATIREWATQLGLDMDVFERCMKSHIKRAHILAEYDEGSQGGVRGTPTFFVNGVQVEATAEGIKKAVENAISGAGTRL